MISFDQRNARRAYAQDRQQEYYETRKYNQQRLKRLRIERYLSSVITGYGTPAHIPKLHVTASIPQGAHLWKERFARRRSYTAKRKTRYIHQRAKAYHRSYQTHQANELARYHREKAAKQKEANRRRFYQRAIELNKK